MLLPQRGRARVASAITADLLRRRTIIDRRYRRRVDQSGSGADATGALLALGAFAGFAAAGILGRAVYEAGGEPLSLLVSRFAASAVVLLALSRGVPRLPRRRIAVLLGAGVVFAGQSLLFYSAVEMAPVSLVVVIVAVYPILVVLLDSVASRHWPPPGRIALLVLALLGLWVAAGAPTGRPGLGIGLAFATAVVYAGYMKATEGLFGGASPLAATFWVVIGAGATVGVAAGLTAPAWPSAAGFAIAAGHGAIATALPVTALYAATRRMGATGVAMLSPIEPVMAMGLAVVFLGETVSAFQLAGVALVLLVVIGLSRSRPRAAWPRVPVVVPRRRRFADARPRRVAP